MNPWVTRGIPLKARLEHHSIPEPNSGCLLWMGAVDLAGYGRLQWKGKARRAHRLAYEVHRGAVPPDRFVCHKCDNPGCIEPNHLFLGTPLDNNRDMMKKGRQVFLVGEKAGPARITEEVAKAILWDFRTQREISEAYGVSQGQVSRIKRGENWKHIRDPDLN